MYSILQTDSVAGSDTPHHPCAAVHRKWPRPGRVIAVIMLLLCSLGAAAADHDPVPRPEGRITDLAQVLSVADRERLTRMLASYEQETSHQLAVLIVPSLAGESIERFSLRVANTWGVGLKGLNNGILVTLAIKEGRVRIELGDGMAKYISDATAQAILTNTMLPALRKRDYAGALQPGLQRLMEEARRFVVTPAERQRAQTLAPNPAFESGR